MTESHPDATAPAGMPIGTTSEAGTPASIITFWVDGRQIVLERDRVFSGAISTIVMGVFPSGVPSMLTRAPAGSVRTCN